MSHPDGRAVFLDRDGTLIEDPGYLRDPGQVCLLPGAGAALTELQRHGFALILVSNQSGIGRGLITPEEAEQVHQALVRQLGAFGVHLTAAFYCPHAPAEACRCRKPSPEFLQQAARELHLDLSRSFMIGDKTCDIEAGQRAGCRSILLAARASTVAVPTPPDAVAANWDEVLHYLASVLQSPLLRAADPARHEPGRRMSS